MDAVFFLAGSFLFAVSIDTFTAPNQIAAGGLTGVATILNHMFGIPIGTANILMNVPLLIWAYVEMGYQIIIKTVVATIVSSAMIDVMVPYLPQYQGEPLITIVFGGCLAGLGLALILMRGGTTGGTELAANLLSLHIHGFSLGKFIMVIDLVIVLASAVVYQEYESPLYAILVIYITSKVIDAVLYGTDRGTGKVMFIISPKNKDWQNYDSVVIGASIRYGHYHAAFQEFVKKHATRLNSMPSAFYSVNLVARKPEKRTPQTNSYARKFLMSSPWRPDHSAVIAGALLYPRYRWYDRVMIQLIMKMSGGETDTNKEVVYTDWEQVARFAREIAQLTNKTSLK